MSPKAGKAAQMYPNDPPRKPKVRKKAPDDPPREPKGTEMVSKRLQNALKTGSERHPKPEAPKYRK